MIYIKQPKQQRSLSTRCSDLFVHWWCYQCTKITAPCDIAKWSLLFYCLM